VRASLVSFTASAKCFGKMGCRGVKYYKRKKENFMSENNNAKTMEKTMPIKRVCASLLLAMVVVMSAIMLSACSYSKNDRDYWFSAYSTKYVEYDANASNLAEAGSYWNFTSARTVDVTLSVIIDVDNINTAAFLYVNGVQVPSETHTDVYTYVYHLSLNKGDSIQLHAFSNYSITLKKFTISYFIMSDGTGNYPVEL
jgi:hypothetical protein